MKRNKLFPGAIASLLIISLLAGCTTPPPPPQKPPEEVIKEAMKKMADITSYKYELAIKGDLTDLSTKGTIKFDLDLNGAVDIKDPKDPKFTLKLTGAGNDSSGQNGAASFDLSLGKEALYFNLMKLDVGQELPADLTKYMSKWWKVTLPPGALDEISKSLPQGEDAELTPEQKELKKLYEETKFFTNPTLAGTEDVKGEQSYHYSVTLDKKALTEFMRKAAEMQGETVPASDIQELEQGLDQADLKADVWVGATSGVLNQMNAEMKGKDGSGTVSFRFTLSDINKPVTLNIPAGAEEFPVEEVLAPLMMMMGGAMPAGDIQMDPDFSGGLTPEDREAMGEMPVPTE